MKALREDPGASKTAISKQTGLSRPTVTKYYDAAKLMAG
ncbi:winged helix-turn-helix domain-containing protein, partial [Campylobacter sp.]